MKPRSNRRFHKHQGKNGGEWRFFEGQKRHFSVAWAKAAKHKPLICPPLCQPTFLAPEDEKNGARHFSRGACRRDPKAEYASATDLTNRGRHGDVAR